MTLTALLAEEPVPAKDGPPNLLGGNPMILLVLMFGLFFLVVMLPAQRRQKREAAAMMAALKAGTKIVTSGGIYGTIVKIKDGEDEVVIKSEDSRLKITRGSIARVLGEDADTKG